MRGLAEQAPRCRSLSPAPMDPQSNPFAVLSLIVAPAILTNAASVLAMSTSNRLARAVDRARELARQLEDTSHPDPSPDEGSRESARRLHELAATEQRAELLMRVLQSFYVALGGFAVAVLSSLLGAVISLLRTGYVVGILEVMAVSAGGVAVAALVRGSALLVRETNIAVQVMHERAESVRGRLVRRGSL
jgi:Protein of unknown function (DUF2721)